jgi:hypothetical protein
MSRYITSLVLVAACSGGARPTTQRVNYPDGTKHYEYALENGLPNGVGRSWHSNGELRSEGEYVAGVKHGLFKFYDDDGAFEYQVFFYKGAEVWRSTDAAAKVPDDVVSGLIAYSPGLPQRGVDEYTRPPTEVEKGFRVELSRDPPVPYFSTLDRTTSLSRVGVQYGFGDAGDRSLGAVTRLELFANYKFSQFGVYGQLLQSSFESSPNMSLSGRRTGEVSTTYHMSAGDFGALSFRGGMLTSLGHDDSEGYIAATAGSYQRITDVASSVPGTVALRTSTSLTRSFSHMILQGDGGVDWLLGGQSSFDPLVRLNAGVGLGVRSGMLSIELANVVRASDPKQHLHTLGLGGTFWFEQLWLTLSASSSLEGHVALTGSMGYEL